MKTHVFVCAFGLCAVLALAGCNCSNSTPPDAAALPDSGLDSGVPNALGVYCSNAQPCPVGYFCLRGQAPGGQCSVNCDQTPCAFGTCFNIGTATAPRSYCFESCQPGLPCPTEQVCEAFSPTASFCVVDCSVHRNVCGPGTDCNFTFDVCLTVGAVLFGDECGAGGGACSSGLTCLQSPGSNFGFCSQPCDANNPCPPSPVGAQCILPIQGTTPTTFCGFPCIPDDAGTSDAGPDAGAADAGLVDAGVVDSGPQDSGVDAGTVDSGAIDSGLSDAGPDAGIDAGLDSGLDSGPPNCPVDLTCLQLSGTTNFLCQ
jgi:hypothetical protein